MPDWGPLAIQGGTVSVLGFLVLRLAMLLVSQATEHAKAWQRTSEIADKRADEQQVLIGEILVVLRGVADAVNQRDRS